MRSPAVLVLLLFFLLALCVFLLVLDLRLGSVIGTENSVVQIGRTGQVEYYANGERFLEDWTPSVKSQMAFIRSFIISLRAVSRDEAENMRTMTQALLACEGTKMLPALQSYIEENNPLLISAYRIAGVDENEISVERYEDGLFKCTWREKWYDPYDGGLIGDRRYEAMVWVSRFQSSKAEEYEYKSYGLQIMDLDISLLEVIK